MWSWSLEWGEVTPGLVIGTCPMTPADLNSIARDARVSALLSLQHDDCHDWWSIDYARMCDAGRRRGLVMERCPMRDFDVADMRRQLPLAVARLASLRVQGHRVYVHCTAGLGRSPLTVLAYLVFVEGCAPQAADELVHAARPGAVPAWEALSGCREDLVSDHRETIEERAYQLYEEGLYGNAAADWNHAQAEVIRAVLLGAMADGVSSMPGKLARLHNGA